MTTAVLFEPASAIAASLCMTARIVNRLAVTERHPRLCGWCDYPVDVLRQMLDGFNEWAGFNEKTGTYSQHDARAFQGLTAREQRHRVLVAQSFPDDPIDEAPRPAPPAPEPMQPAAPLPGDAEPPAAEEELEWVL